MIAGLRGTVSAKTAEALLVDVGGVIYRVGTSATTIGEAGEVGDEVRLHTHLVVREDTLALFGFTSLDELAIFETLITVSGIGPRLACAVLSHLQPQVLLLAISEGDVDRLATVSGIGKKTAARLVVELRGKLPEGIAGSVPGGLIPIDDEAVSALRALGYTAAEANNALARTAREGGGSVEERVFDALRHLGGER
jgi:Holliday junction DNA helicase RuvA